MNQSRIESKQLKKETDLLAEAYSAIDRIRQVAFYDQDVNGDIAEFLGTMARQINLYRVSMINQKVYGK